MNNENIFYVYLHRRKTDKKVFYVGKGKHKRAFDVKKRNEYWLRTYEKHGLIVDIAFDNLSEQEAFQVEMDTILEFRYFDHPLTNMTDGGEGCSGQKQSEQTRLKRSVKMKGRKLSSEHVRKISENSKLQIPILIERNTDFSTYRFLRKDGELFCGTRAELCEKYSLNPKLLRSIFTSKSKTKTSQNWSLLSAEDIIQDKLISINTIAKKVILNPPKYKRDDTAHLFINKNGEFVYLTRFEFKNCYSISPNCLFGKKSVHTIFEWGVARSYEDYDTAFNRIKFSRTNNRYDTTDQNIYNFKHKTGETFCGTRSDLIDKYALGKYAKSSLSKMFSKTNPQSVYGWSLLKETNDNNTT